MSSGVHVFRFSLTTLFGAVLFAAFAVAAIRFASPLWAGLTMAVTVPILFAAILGALFRLGQARAFWTGTAVCGWGYLIVVLAPWFETGLGEYLPTSYLLSYVHGQLQKQVPMAGTSSGGMPMGGPGGSTGPTMGGMGPGGIGPGGRWMSVGGGVVPRTTGTDDGLLRRTGHALFALLFGFIGGVTAKWFYVTRLPNEHRAGGE
jgi:hypothetical protein